MGLVYLQVIAMLLLMLHCTSGVPCHRRCTPPYRHCVPIGTSVQYYRHFMAYRFHRHWYFQRYYSLYKMQPMAFKPVSQYATMTKLPFLSRQANITISNDTAGLVQGCPDTTRHDGDVACPSCRYFFYHDPAKPFMNIYDEPCYVVQLSGWARYQFVSAAQCGTKEHCRGSCIQQTRIHLLLAWNINNNPPTVSFEPFYIPSYCSCQNPARDPAQ